MDTRTLMVTALDGCTCEWDVSWDAGDETVKHYLTAGCPAHHGYDSCPECARKPWVPIVGMVDGELEMRCVECLKEDTGIDVDFDGLAKLEAAREVEAEFFRAEAIRG